MPNNTSDLRFDPKYDHLIAQIRDKVSDKLTKDEKYEATYYQFDLNRLMQEDWRVRRFLLHHNGNVDSTVKAIISSFQYLKSNRLRELKDTDFPAEMWELGGLFLYEADNEGRPTLYLRTKHHLMVKELTNVKIQFITYLSMKADDAAGMAGFTTISDTRDISMQNLDVEMSLTLLTLGQYFPFAVARIIIVEMPFIARAAYHLVKYAMPAILRNTIVHCSCKDVKKYVPIERLPIYLNGTCSKVYCGPAAVPEGCISMQQYCRDVLELPSDKVDKLANVYAPLLKSIHKEVQHFDENNNFNMKNLTISCDRTIESSRELALSK